jgi:dTDP-4-dehydrorhamnose reductase
VKVALIGARGQLGTDLLQAMNAWDVVAWSHRDVEICDFSATRDALTAAAPDLVINTAAFHRVDECEALAERALQVNALAVRNLARICEELRCALLHVSTDYVFGGEQRVPYAETDAPVPLNAYGVSKLAGELFVRRLCRRHFVVRSCGLYGVAGSSGKGGNFVETMVRLSKEGRTIRVVDDQVLTPTYTKDLAEKIVELVRTERYGLYHITNGGSCSWYEFTKEIFRILEVSPDLAPTTTEAFGSAAERPAYSVLAHGGIVQIGLADLRPWTEAVAAYLRQKGHLQT